MSKLVAGLFEPPVDEPPNGSFWPLADRPLLGTTAEKRTFVASACSTSANDPLRTLATVDNLARMVRSVVLITFGAIVGVASSASATPPPPPAPHNWTKISWECPGQERSFIEIEQLAQGSSGYQTKVVGLVISGRKIDPATIAGLEELVARRNYLRPVGGYCDSRGEMIGIEELASGPKKAEAGWRSFRIPYAPRP